MCVILLLMSYMLTLLYFLFEFILLYLFVFVSLFLNTYLLCIDSFTIILFSKSLRFLSMVIKVINWNKFGMLFESTLNKFLMVFIE